MFWLARTWRTRPSVLLDVRDPYVALQLDSAIATFGNALMYELDRVEGKDAKQIEAAQERIVNQWLGRPQKFANPGAKKTKKGGEKAV